MAKFVLSAFADEAGTTLDEQIAALKRNGISYIEPRNINGKPILTLTDDELIEVKKVICVAQEDAVLRELLLVKIETNSENLDAVVRTAAHNHFRIVDSCNGCMVLETSGSPDKIERMLKLLEPFDIVEMCRTGVTALEKGTVDYNL